MALILSVRWNRQFHEIDAIFDNETSICEICITYESDIAFIDIILIMNFFQRIVLSNG